MEFTPTQLAAIRHAEGHLQLVACAGSGKTEVVARRVAWLLRPRETGQRVLPRNIVAFTFTEKAAAELKERVVQRCREELGELPGMAELYVGTIHAFCLELLKSEVPEYLKYEVLNEVQQNLFVDRHSRSSGLTQCADLQGKLLRRHIDTDRYVAALDILRETALDEPKLRGNSIVTGLRAYRQVLRDKSYFDYSAIMATAVGVLQNSAGLRARIANRIRHVIVDEYQDVNPIQECIVRLLSDLGAHICVVGDDDQTIYQWRGSDVENILEFHRRYPGVTRVRLEENFRSSRGVVETARDFIQQNSARLEKAMIPTDAQPYEPGDIAALHFDGPEAEAQYIVETIQSLRGVAFRDGDAERGLSFSDMAILLRSVRQNAEPITKALQAAGIPFLVGGMNNLFDQPEAQAARLLFYFMASRPDVDEARVAEAWRVANLGVADADLARAIEAVRAARASLSEPEQKRWALYSIQRVFLDFLENAGVREEKVPGSRGEIIFYNLGKFSQVISDFEQIYFHSKPAEKYVEFANFLEYQADKAYPEGWQENAYANPDAVRIMTVHTAKGMQWPAVFVPALLKNRFPAPKMGGRSVWHLLPKDAVIGQSRFEGSIEDERRLFYVAMTRSRKFLYMTWGPIDGKNNRYVKPSEFWEDVLASKYVKRRPPDLSGRRRLQPEPRAGVANVVLSFSDLKYFFECPYQFKLRILYGFNAPIHEALGYGKSLHDALAEVHSRAMRADLAKPDEVPRLVATHLHTPFAYTSLREQLEASAERVLRDYLADNQRDLRHIEFSEKTIELGLGDGISVAGRIDLVRRVDTGEVSIVDLKTKEQSQDENVTDIQLHIYALGYQELTGRNADKVETYLLDERKRKPRSVDEDFLDDVKANIRTAAAALRRGQLAAKPRAQSCASCDYLRMCTAGQAAKE